MNWLREPDSEPIPGYRLIEPLGTGGFGEVWKCVAPGGIHKAIKFVYGNLNSLDGDDARALQEKKALERVKEVRHPFVLSIEQIQEVSGELCIVMELADKNLHEVLVEYQQAGRPGIPREVLLGLLDDAAVGLDHLIEKHNLQHLDVKPRNLFTVADRVKVADFGLVKQLERSSSSGLMGGVTPIYAAPETFSNKISKHSDQYSLGIVYVELLTGKRPFSGKNIRQLALQHMTEPPDLDMLPEADRPIVARALAKDPDGRFPSCLAFVRALGGGNSGSGSGNAAGPVAEPAAWARTGKTIHDVDLTPGRRGGVAVLPAPPRSKHGLAARHETEESHLLGVTAATPDVGILRPTVLIGVGSFGRRALQEVRCRLVDRVGDIAQVPSFRFLYVDVDPDAVNKAVSAPPDVALSSDEVFPVPLQPVTGYRRRQLEQILDWLPREKLYSIPRNLHAGGSRALGRLAFCDNYLRFVARIRRELQIATHPESLSQSADQSGLAPRDNVPQVYVFASGVGSSGGMILDIGHAVRRVLSRLGTAEATVGAFIYGACPTDAGTSDRELANLYATLTELNHYADPDMTFVAQYGGTEGPRVEAKGLPFDATYVLPMPERSPTAFRDCVSHLAGYVAHDLTTPLGSALEQGRRKPAGFGRSPFRGFGTYGVWFPRGLLLRAAGQKICLDLIKGWLCDGPPADPIKGDVVVTQVMGDPRLKPEAVQKQLEQAMPRGGEGGTGEQLERWLHGLEGQLDAPNRRQESSVWAKNAWDQAREMIGNRPTGENDSAVRRSRLSKALEESVKRVAEVWANEFTEVTRPLEDDPGRRLAAIEAALRRIAGLCVDAADAVDKRVEQFGVKCRQARTDAQSALDACAAGSGTFSFFGGRSGRSARHFLDQLRQFARLRLQEDLLDATARFYRVLRGKVEDRLRQISYYRTRLTHLVQVMESPLLHLPAGSDTPVALPEEALQQTLHPTNTLQVVLPSGDNHIDRSAAKVVKSVKPSDLVRLEHALQKLVLEPRGGLTAVCQTNTDMTRLLVAPMIEQTTAFLSDLLPVTDVAEVEVSTSQAIRVDLSARIRDYHKRAVPPCGGSAEDEQTFVLVPDTASGKAFASQVRAVVPAALTVPVQGAATDLMFCREHACLRTDEVLELVALCQPAYYAALASAHTNPHARFDVGEWLPLGE